MDRLSNIRVASVARVSVLMVGFLFNWDLHGRLTKRPFTGPRKVRRGGGLVNDERS